MHRIETLLMSKWVWWRAADPVHTILSGYMYCLAQSAFDSLCMPMRQPVQSNDRSCFGKIPAPLEEVSGYLRLKGSRCPGKYVLISPVDLATVLHVLLFTTVSEEACQSSIEGSVSVTARTVVLLCQTNQLAA